VALIIEIGVSFYILAGDEKQEGVVINKYEVEVASRLYVPPTDNNRDTFPNGFSINYGSSLTFKGIGSDGTPLICASTAGQRISVKVWRC
jgi:hypothetical protein